MNIIFLFVPLFLVEMVKHNDFKTCEQSPFCVRNQNYIQTISNFTITSSSFFHLVTPLEQINKSAIFVGDLKRNNELFLLTIKLLEDGPVYISIEPSDLKRYSIYKEVIIDDKLTENYEFIQENNITNLINKNLKIEAIVNHSPFSIDIKKEGVITMTFNNKNYLNIETNVKKEEPVSSDNNEQPLSKEESFNGFIDSRPNGDESFGLDLTFYNTLNIYGIPEHASSLNLKDTKNEINQPYRLYNLDVFEYEMDSPMALYGSVPFMLSHSINNENTKSSGVLVVNAAEMWIDITKEKNINGFNIFKKEKNTNSHWISEAGKLEVFMFTANSPKDIVKQYTKLTGRAQMIPMFSLGHHQCRWNYIDDNDVVTINSQFDKYDIPLDVIWLDIEHTQDKKYFTFDSIKFGNIKETQEILNKTHRKLVTIIDPHIKRDNDYHIFKEATNLDLFIKNKDNEVYEGWCWPGSSSWPDFTKKETIDWWIKKLEFNEYTGSTNILHVWNDMNEPSVFNGPEITMQKDLIHNNNIEHRLVHNLYGLLVQKATYLGILKREEPSKRPFVLSRAAFIGTQRYGSKWTGDNAAEWSHLKASIPMTLSLSISGVSIVGADVGGFFGNPENELLVRWYQTAIFQPFLRAHAHIDTKRREAYLLENPYRSIIREALRLRYKLSLYWYTLMFENHISGIPPMRPMFMEFPNDRNVLEMEDQHMVGENLLVKPITEKEIKETKTYLPTSNKWTNYFTLTERKNGYIEEKEINLNTILLYIKNGAIIPIKNRVRRALPLMKKDPISLLVILDDKKEANGRVYLDNEEGFEYINNEYVYMNITFSNNVLTNKKIKNVELPKQEDGLTTSSTKNLNEIEKIEIEKITIVGIPPSQKNTQNNKYKYYKENKILVIKKPELKVALEWQLKID